MALLTGSRVYGTPHEDSDLDIVLLVTQEEKEMIVSFTDEHAKEETLSGRCSFRIGNLNLILVTNPAAFEVWKRGTEDLTAVKPVSRNQAVEYFTRLRTEAGVTFSGEKVLENS